MVISKRLKLLRALFSNTSRSIHLKAKSKQTSTTSTLKARLTESAQMPTLPEETEEINTYARLLEACIQSKSLTEGKKIHHHIQKHNTHMKNSFLRDKVVSMYIACKEIDLARLTFDEIRKPGVFLWNSMIRFYAWNGPFDQAIELYEKMIKLGVQPNKFTFTFVLKACSGLLALDEGREIHDQAKRFGLDSDVFVCTALVDLYAKCGCLDDAYRVFDKMAERDVVAWNAMVAGSALHGFYGNTIRLVFEMQKAGKSPNSSTVVAVLPVLGQAKSLLQGKSMHGYCVRRCFDKEVLVGTAVLDMYAKCECLNYARRVFDVMNIRNEVTWSAMIGAFVLCDRMVDALSVFDLMMLQEALNPTSAALGSALRACARLNDLRRGRQVHSYSTKSGFALDITVGNSLLSMYAKSGIINDAVKFFDEMQSKDTVSYSAIISGCVQNGNAEDALLIFRKMQASGIEPDLATMVGVIPACAHLAALQHGRCNHGYVIIRGFHSDISICNALIDMYSKCGKIVIAREIFDSMLERDIVSWNSLIAGFGIHGLGKEALALFDDLQRTGLRPDDVTFISLLSACSHSGLVSEGRHWFHLMTTHFNITLRMEHCICMVDLLGRSSLLDEAYDFIQRLPFEPDVHVWGALLGACRIHDNFELGEEVSKAIQKLGPEGTGNFVLLSNIFSAAGRWDDAANVRIIQREQGFRKSPGCSWIEIDGTVHAFIGGDRSHPQSTQIYAKLEELLGELKELGYIADASFVLQDVEEEEKERILLYHSEKLAIAFGILNLGPKQPIFITKNLRVCGDCHTAIKFITTVMKRAITVRDASRFHHFDNGACNCKDFW